MLPLTSSQTCGWVSELLLLALGLTWTQTISASITASASTSGSASAQEINTGIEWLTKFGYLPPTDPVTGQLQTQEALTKAIRAMQTFGGLKISGILDQATLSLMETRRCSLPDVPAQQAARRRRSAPTGNKWNKRNLSWRIRAFPLGSQLSRDTVRALMFYALKVWSDIAPLNFHEVGGERADILIDFCKAFHNDNYPFDGPGGAVAHAFFPGGGLGAGNTHFDDDEEWTFRSSDAQKMDLFAVAVHEFGHALGLSHSSANHSIMRPYYQGPIGDPLKYQLPYDDKLRIWQLYGVRDLLISTSLPGANKSSDYPTLPKPPESRPTALLRPDAPDRCNTHFDAVAQIRGEAFFFKGKYFWRLTRSKHLVSLQPAMIHRFWWGLPSNLGSLDAVYERTVDHKIIFFKGGRYWVFKNNNAEEGSPRLLADFGLPVQGIEAAFVWPHNDKTYFFKDNRYWRYDDRSRSLDPEPPEERALWKGLPSNIDDAMSWSDGTTYFFKGKSYWKVLAGRTEVSADSPGSIARDWLLCGDMQPDEAGEAEPASSRHSRPDRTGSEEEEEEEEEEGEGDTQRTCSCGSAEPAASGRVAGWRRAAHLAARLALAAAAAAL